MCVRKQGIINVFTRFSLNSPKSTPVSSLKNRKTSLRASRSLVIFRVKTKVWWENLKSWKESIVIRGRELLKCCKASKDTSHSVKKGMCLQRDSVLNYHESVTRVSTWCVKSKLRNKKSHRSSRTVNAERLRMKEPKNESMSCSRRSESCRTVGKLVLRIVRGCSLKSTSTKRKLKT